jgi:hypothetical protein
MSSSEPLSAPVIPSPADDKWRTEQRAFYRLLPELTKLHPDHFVAIHEEGVVESGPDKVEVARRAYARFGYVPIFVSQVTDRPLAPVRIPSPRLVRPGSFR